jgi:hypothetical protein
MSTEEGIAKLFAKHIGTALINSMGHSTNKPLSTPAELSSKIEWRKSQRLLASLVLKLRDKGYIEANNPWALISKHFSWKGQEITRDSIKSNHDQALNRKQNRLGPDARSIDHLLQELDVDSALDNE